LISYIKDSAQARHIGEQVAEDDVWIYEAGGKKSLEKTAQRGASYIVLDAKYH
jgi:hypothetical protein